MFFKNKRVQVNYWSIRMYVYTPSQTQRKIKHAKFGKKSSKWWLLVKKQKWGRGLCLVNTTEDNSWRKKTRHKRQKHSRVGISSSTFHKHKRQRRKIQKSSSSRLHLVHHLHGTRHRWSEPEHHQSTTYFGAIICFFQHHLQRWSTSLPINHPKTGVAPSQSSAPPS